MANSLAARSFFSFASAFFLGTVFCVLLYYVYALRFGQILSGPELHQKAIAEPKVAASGIRIAAIQATDRSAAKHKPTIQGAILDERFGDNTPPKTVIDKG